MIARTWSGRTKAEDAKAYTAVLLETGIVDLKATPGNRGTLLLRRTDEEEAEFILISLWDSLESIKAFAGEDVDIARYYPDDDPYLLDKAEKVVHYDVVSGLNAV